MCKPYSCASFYMDNIDSCAIKLTQLRELRAIHCDICAIKAKIGAIITKMCVIQVDSPHKSKRHSEIQNESASSESRRNAVERA